MLHPIRCSILAAVLMMTAALSAPPAKPSPGQRIAAFALEACRANATPQEAAALRLAPNEMDTSYRPFGDWSPELRAVLQRHFKETEDPALQSWLRRPEPFAGVELKFQLLPSVDIRVFDTSCGKLISRPEEMARLADFLDSLDAKQRKALFAQGMTVRQAVLNPQQRSFAGAIGVGRGLMEEGQRLENHPQARLGLRFQLDAFLKRVEDGKTETVQVRMFHITPTPGE